MKKMNEIKAWVKAHKKQIAVTAGLGGLVAFAATRMTASEDLEIPELDVGKITELWKEGNEEVIRMIAEDLTVADLGRFGEELVEKISDVTPESTVGAFMGIGRKK